jgi:hypothetical protein
MWAAMGWLGLLEGKEKKQITDTELPQEEASSKPQDDEQTESSRPEISKSAEKAKKKQRQGEGISPYDSQCRLSF